MNVFVFRFLIKSISTSVIRFWKWTIYDPDIYYASIINLFENNFSQNYATLICINFITSNSFMENY